MLTVLAHCVDACTQPRWLRNQRTPVRVKHCTAMNTSQRKTRKTKNSRNSRRNAMPPEMAEQFVPGIPKPSGGEIMKPKYNPTWNPQYLKVRRSMMYSVPAADVVSPYIQDPAVGSLAANLSFNSGAISFRVGDVYNVTEYGALFDQYRINAVTLHFHYISASQTTMATGSSYQQQCTCVLYEDYDDSTSPATTLAGWNAILESGRGKKAVFPNSRNVLSYTVNPKYLTVEVDNSAGTTGRGTGDDWLDGSTSPDVVWRGVKWALQANPSTTTPVHTFRVYADYYLTFRQRQ